MSRLLPFVAVVFSIAIIALYVRPTYSGPIHDTRELIKSYDDALAAADRFKAKEAELTQARSQIPPDSLSRLDEFLPDGVDNVQLILDLNALAARSGMTLSDFDTQNSSSGTSATPANDASLANTTQPLGLVSSSPIDSLNLTFKGVGTYNSFRTFVDGMESSLRPLDIINVDVTRAESGVYTYVMSVRIYWLR